MADAAGPAGVPENPAVANGGAGNAEGAPGAPLDPAAGLGAGLGGAHLFNPAFPAPPKTSYRWLAYSLLSLAATAGVIYHAFETREQFYPAVVFLVSSKISIAVRQRGVPSRSASAGTRAHARPGERARPLGGCPVRTR